MMQPTADRPRFRQDLVAELIEDGGKRFIDVADPDSGSVFRFYEVEYSLACAMDGERDVGNIVQWAKEELGLAANVNEVRSVIATLGSLGYLETAAAAAAAARPVEPPARPTPPSRPTPPPQPVAKPVANNRWDQPTEVDDRGEYLGQGVVVGKQPNVAAPPADDVELGHAAAARRADPGLPQAPDLELGAAGTKKQPPVKTVMTEEIPLGVAGRANEPSLDLSEGLAIDRNAVKEAVRQSQVMRSVDVPKELLDSVEPVIRASSEPKPEARPEPKRPEPKPEPRPEPKQQQARPASQPAPAPRAASEPAKAPPAPAPKVSPALIVFAVVVVLGAAAFLVYKYVIQKSQNTDQAAVAPPPPPVKAPEPPPPPPVETEKLATEQPADQELKAAVAGQLDTVENGKDVKAGEVIATLVGHKPLEAEIANLKKAKAPADKLATKQADLDKYLVKAPTAGKIAAVGKPGARVTPADVVAKLTPVAQLVTTFKKADAATADARVLLGIKGKEQKISCKVVAADPGATKIACPSDAASDGAEVTYEGLDPTPPPATNDEIEMNEGSGAAAGSAAGSAAPTPAPPPPPKAPPPPRPAMRPPVPKAPPPKKEPTEGSAAAPAPAPPAGDQPPATP